MQSFSSAHNFFHLVKNSSSQSRTCIYVNKCLKLDQWTVKTAESDICLIRILTCNTDNETQMLRLLNIYNSSSLFITFTERFSTISCLNELLKNNCKQLVIENFNLHHSHWERRRCFTWHMMIDILLNVIINARLKLLLKSDTITRKIHSQFTIINLVFSSEKIQFMTRKCEVWIDLYQKSDHFLIVTELNLQKISVQFLTRWLWKKNEHRSIECLSANTFFVRSLSEQQNWNEWQSDRNHQSTTRDHWEVYFLSKIIKLSKKLLKSELLQSSNEIKMTANHMKNVRHIRNMKWISETQWSQK